MEMSNEVWIWLIIGGLLLASEMFTGTFYLLFFGISALATAGLALIDLSFVAQLSLFSVFAVASVWLVRKKGLRGESKGFSNDVSQVVVLSQDLKAGQVGTIQYQGAPWSAVNGTSQDLFRGDRARIVKTEGVKIWIEKMEG